MQEVSIKDILFLFIYLLMQFKIMKKILLFTIALFFAQTIFAQTIDSEASKVEFEVSNLGRKVKGSLSKLEGTVNFNIDNLEESSFEASLDPSTVTTKSSARDEHLRTDDFFGVEEFPLLKIKSTKIVKTKTGYEAKVILTIRDVSMPLTLPFTIEEEGNRQHLIGTLVVERKKYDLGKKMGRAAIGLEVTATIDCFVDLN